MFIKLLCILHLWAQASASSLRLNPMTTVVPKPHVTVYPTDITYQSIPRDQVLYNPTNHYLR